MSIFDRFKKKDNSNLGDSNEITTTVKRPKKLPNSIQLQIIIELEHLLENAEKDIVPQPQETKLPIPKEVADLLEAGFGNTRIVQEFKEKQKVLSDKYSKELEIWTIKSKIRRRCIEALKCLMQARKVYGPDTLLLPYDQFEEICKKWDLTCGSFDCYAGDIPEDKLQEIMELKKITSSEVPIIELSYVKEFYSEIDLSSRDDVFANEVRAVRDKLLKFPFVRETHVRKWEVLKAANGKSRTTYVTFADGTEDNSCFYDVICGECSKFFITAPKKMMGEGLKITTIPRAKRDPFICAATKYGILIFTRWGEEASDEVIQKLEAFNKNLEKLNL